MKITPLDDAPVTESEAADVLSAALPAALLSYVSDTQDCVKILSSDGHVRYINKPGRKLLGQPTLEAVIGRLWWDLWEDAEKAALQDALACAATGATMRFQMHRAKPGATKGQWEITASPIAGGDGLVQAVMVVSHPVDQGEGI